MTVLTKLHSLRAKITSAYIALVMATSMLGIIAFLDLLYLESRISDGEVVSSFKDAVFDMRREEKNLFLYNDEDAYRWADEHAATALDILENQRASIDALGTVKSTALAERIRHYRDMLKRWTDTDGQQAGLQDELSVRGQQIMGMATDLAARERNALQEAVKQSRWFLLVSLLLIGVAILIVGRHLRRVAVRPLRAMEESMAPIADGRFDHLAPPSLDREFLTLTSAFNRMLKELAIRRKRMLQSDKLASLGTLSAGIAHEINNSLSNVSSSCQLLLEELEEAEPQQLREWLCVIDSETARGRDIVRTLLDFGSQRVFNRQHQQLLGIVEETRTILAKTLRQHEASLDIRIPAALELEVDKQRMQQLFINLFQNAMNAARGPVTIHIEAGVFDSASRPRLAENVEVAGDIKCLARRKGEELAEIRVTDTGPGIAPENLPKVFDPFYTTSEPGQGTGLGLFIVHEIVREHDGCLAIHSVPGEGTSLIILLPLREKDDA
ncbi:MAG: HAMP domain-containing sensor histidine kinase [Gammaproteobacteria bacterium]|jgi:two-component system, NtrC family, sensor kinase